MDCKAGVFCVVSLPGSCQPPDIRARTSQKRQGLIVRSNPAWRRVLEALARGTAPSKPTLLNVSRLTRPRRGHLAQHPGLQSINGLQFRRTLTRILHPTLPHPIRMPRQSRRLQLLQPPEQRRRQRNPMVGKRVISRHRHFGKLPGRPLAQDRKSTRLNSSHVD